MKAMIFSDLITMKNSAIQLTASMLIIGIFMIAFVQSVNVGVAAIGAALPFMYFFSISAYDEMNNWEHFRLTLPITRRQVAFGRYGSTAIVILLSFLLAIVIGFASIGIITALSNFVEISPELLSSADPLYMIASDGMSTLVILIATAIGFPAIMRFGLTKGTRLVPVIITMLLCLGIILMDNTPLISALENAISTGTIAILWIAGIVFAVVLYIASALLSARLYAKRNF